MEIVVDYRERDLLNEFDKLKIPYKRQNLNVGDIHLINDGIVIYIIERKTASDYVASIKDHRLKNQIARINSFQQTNPQTNFILLVEGGFQTTFGQPIQISDYIYNSILHRILQDNIPVIRSDNLSETVIWIQKLLIIAKPKRTINSTNNNTKCDDYLQTIAVKKSQNMTPENCYILQLTQIPGISLTIARAISEKYPSWVNLITNYQNLSTSEGLLMLSKLSVGQKKIGKSISNKVYNYLFPIKRIHICLKWRQIKV